MARKSVLDLHEMKRRGEKITWLTAYDYPTASFEAQAGIDMILVVTPWACASTAIQALCR